VDILGVEGPRKSKCVTRHPAKFRGDGQTVAEIWQFLFFKMAVVRHFGFVMRVFGPSAKST